VSSAYFRGPCFLKERGASILGASGSLNFVGGGFDLFWRCRFFFFFRGVFVGFCFFWSAFCAIIFCLQLF